MTATNAAEIERASQKYTFDVAVIGQSISVAENYRAPELPQCKGAGIYIASMLRPGFLLTIGSKFLPMFPPILPSG